MSAGTWLVAGGTLLFLLAAVDYGPRLWHRWQDRRAMRHLPPVSKTYYAFTLADDWRSVWAVRYIGAPAPLPLHEARREAHRFMGRLIATGWGRHTRVAHVEVWSDRRGAWIPQEWISDASAGHDGLHLTVWP